MSLSCKALAAYSQSYTNRRCHISYIFIVLFFYCFSVLFSLFSVLFSLCYCFQHYFHYLTVISALCLHQYLSQRSQIQVTAKKLICPMCRNQSNDKERINNKQIKDKVKAYKRGNRGASEAARRNAQAPVLRPSSPERDISQGSDKNFGDVTGRINISNCSNSKFGHCYGVNFYNCSFCEISAVDDCNIHNSSDLTVGTSVDSSRCDITGSAGCTFVNCSRCKPRNSFSDCSRINYITLSRFVTFCHAFVMAKMALALF